MSELLHDKGDFDEAMPRQPALRREPSNPDAPVTIASASLKAASAASHIVANHVFRVLALEHGLVGGSSFGCADVGLDVIQITQKKADSPSRLFVKPDSPALAAVKLFYYGKIEASMSDGAMIKGQYINIGSFEIQDFTYNLFLIPFPGTALAASANSCAAWMVPLAGKNVEPTMLIKEKTMNVEVEPAPWHCSDRVTSFRLGSVTNLVPLGACQSLVSFVVSFFARSLHCTVCVCVASLRAVGQELPTGKIKVKVNFPFLVVDRDEVAKQKGGDNVKERSL
jgi:hypothetical protein